MIPIVMFLSIAVVFIALFWFRYKTRGDLQQTLRAAMDKGVELSPDLVDRLGAPKRQKAKDLRLGVIWMALAAGLIMIALIDPSGTGDPSAFRGTLAGAAFPFCIGAAYLLLYFLVSKKEESE